MRRVLLVLLAGAMLLGVAGVQNAVSGESLKPVAVVSLAGYQEVMNDVAFVGKLADRPALDLMLEGLLAIVTQGRGLVGIDKGRPWGSVLGVEGDQAVGYAFLPVTSLKQLLSLAEAYADVKESGQGVFRVTPRNQGKSLFVKEQGGWAFMADKAETLGRVTSDPLALLGGLEKQYLLAARFYLANVPAKLRNQFVEQVKKGVERDLGRPRSGESPDDFAARKKTAQEAQDIGLGFLGDLDEITLGWTLDRKAEKTYADVSVTARPGTATAQQFAALSGLTSAFGGFRLPGATLTANWANVIPENQRGPLANIVAEAKRQMARDIQRQNKPAEEQQVARQIVDALADMVRKTVASGRVDGGAAVMLDPKSATVLGGGYLADAAQLEKALRSLGDLVKRQHPEVADWIKFDAGNFSGVNFHTVSIPIPPTVNDRDKIVELLGETLDVVVGIGKDSTYVAAGRNAMETLKKAIQASAAETSQAVPPARIAVDVEPIFRTLAAVGKEQDRAKAKLVADELKKQAGKDHITLVGKPISNGVSYRLEVEPGILRAAGRIAVLAQEQGL